MSKQSNDVESFDFGGIEQSVVRADKVTPARLVGAPDESGSELDGISRTQSMEPQHLFRLIPHVIRWLNLAPSLSKVIESGEGLGSVPA
ncbi:MAG: hypothetical protein AB7H86_17175 [Blastocatellales bacterium]